MDPVSGRSDVGKVFWGNFISRAPLAASRAPATWGRCLLIWLGILLLAAEAGCVSYHHASLTEVPFRNRLAVKRDGEISVAAAALGPDESRRLFGADLHSLGIQPVWLEIENKSTATFVFFMRSVDPHYFSPREAAHLAHVSAMGPFYEHGILSAAMWPLLPFVPVRAITASSANEEMDAYFDQASIGNESLSPGERIEGFVFTRADAGTKRIPVSLVGAEGRRDFTLFVKVPGTVVDHELIEFDAMYPDGERIDDHWESFADTMTQMPNYTTNRVESKQGDPVNLVIVGDLDNVLEAFTLAGWDETEPLCFATAWRTARSFMSGEGYRTSPVSNLYLFGRRQDFALQKTRDTINARNHLRLWHTPWKVEGKPVWLGQVSRDIGVRFTWRTWNLTTHEIDPDVDDARDNVLGDLVDTGRVSMVGFFRGPKACTLQNPSRNLTEDPYYTDGERLVVVLEAEPTALQVFDWHHKNSRSAANLKSRNSGPVSADLNP